MALTGTLLSARYRLESKLGSGGMSTVYLALDETLDRPVAVKLMHLEISDQPDQLERFRREARSAARLSHPNLVGVIDAGEDGGRPYIVFEYVAGETLKHKIQRVGALPVGEAVAYAIEIGRGLSAAHTRKLVHRDVKPQNVLIDSDGRAKVTDFGIARSLESKSLTATGRVIGTTDYISPEQAMGELVDDRSDIYSLGIVLYEMLSGDVPYHAETQVGVAMQHVHEPLPDVRARRPEVSASVAAVIDRATTKEPSERYRSVPEMVDDLEASLEIEAARGDVTTGEVTAVLKSIEGRRGKGASRVGILMGVLGVGLIVAALIVGERTGLELGGKDQIQLGNASASDFDPDGDDSEGPDTVKLAVDGNPTGTAWGSEHYFTDDFGGTKSGSNPGVGLIVDAGDEVSLSKLEVRSPTTGWDGEIYAAASGPPTTLADWEEPVAAITGAAQTETIDLKLPRPARYYLVWITKLPPANEQVEAGGFQVEISDIRLVK